MVGDIRQAILATNEREAKNKKYKFMKIWDWFRAEAKADRLTITQRCASWRCRPEIVMLADSLFGPEWGFDATISRNKRTTSHDGIFLVPPADVNAYARTFAPLSLRYSQSSGKGFTDLDFMNFGKAKGLGRDRVLVCPTDKIAKFLQKGLALDEQAAAHLYVAVTRAEQSVAFILEKPGDCQLPYWEPTPTTPDANCACRDA